MFPNVQVDESFIDEHFTDTATRLQQWLPEAMHGRGTVIEIGAGYNTPSVIRWPGEEIVNDASGWHLVRINADHAEVPEELGKRAVGIQGDAGLAIAELCGVVDSQ